MTGVLILAHGSRDKDTEITLEKVVSRLREELKMDHIETAFLQFSENSLEKSLKSLVGKGIMDIKVVPYFLFAGAHVKRDIPGEIEEFLRLNPDAKITMGRSLGDDPRLAMILADRVGEII